MRKLSGNTTLNKGGETGVPLRKAEELRLEGQQWKSYKTGFISSEVKEELQSIQIC